jgi:hypothetical protein
LLSIPSPPFLSFIFGSLLNDPVDNTTMAKFISPSLNKYRRELATNHLEKLMELYPGEDWDHFGIYGNPWLSGRIRRIVEKIYGCQMEVARDPTEPPEPLDCEYMIDNLHTRADWDYRMYTKDPGMTWDMI